MKKLILKVTVPDDFNPDVNYFQIDIREVPGGDIWDDNIEFTEIIIPIEDKIEKLAMKKANRHALSSVGDFAVGFIWGAKWMLKQITK